MTVPGSLAPGFIARYCDSLSISTVKPDTVVIVAFGVPPPQPSATVAHIATSHIFVTASS